jgi:hypothetical protein
VLVARLGGKEGDTWTAVRDTIETPNFGNVYLESHATAMADTSIMVLGSPVQCHHVRFVITAIGSAVTATEIADTYISPELGTTVSDFFRSVSIPAPIAQKAKGSYKIMTYHE